MKERVICAIALLGLSYDFQGGVRFLSMKAGRVLDWNQNDFTRVLDHNQNEFTILPTPVDALTLVNQMALKLVDGLTIEDINNIIDNFITQTNNNHCDKIIGVDNTNADINVDIYAIQDLELAEQDPDSDDKEDEVYVSGNWDDDDDDNDSNNNYEDMMPLVERDSDDYDSSDDESSVEAQVTTCSGHVVNNWKEDNFTYTQVDSDLAPEKIQVEHNKNEVQNYIGGLTEIKNSAKYQDHLYTLVFIQLNIKQGIKTYPVEKKSVHYERIGQHVFEIFFW